MSIQVVGVNPGGEVPDVQGAETREDGSSFAGLFEQVKKSKPPAHDERKVEKPEDDRPEAQAEKASDSAAAAAGGEDVVAPVQQQEQRTQETSAGRSAPEAADEGETAGGRASPQSAKEAVQVAPRQSLLEANQELNLMLKFTAAASQSFEMHLRQNEKGQQDMAMLLPRKDVALPAKEAKSPRFETDRTKTETPQTMAKGAGNSPQTARSEVERQWERAMAGEPDGARPQSAEPRPQSAEPRSKSMESPADGGSGSGKPDAQVSTTPKGRGPEAAATQSQSQRTSMNAAATEVRAEEPALESGTDMAKPVTSDPLAKTGTIGTRSGAPLGSATAQPAAAQPAAPEVDLANQIVQSAKLLMKNGQESIEIRLKPDILGKLFMRIEVVDRAMTAQMTVQSEQVKTMIESQLQSLQTALESSGLRLNRVAIHVEDSQRAGSRKSDTWNHEQPSPDDQHSRRDGRKDEESNERSKRPPRDPRQVHIRV